MGFNPNLPAIQTAMKKGMIVDQSSSLTRPICPVVANEEQFQKETIAVLQKYDWRVMHTRRARAGNDRFITPVAADGKGFPDLIAVRERVLAIELKAEDGYPKPEQLAWWHWFRQAGIESYIWRPSDWDKMMEIIATPSPLPPGSRGSHPLKWRDFKLAMKQYGK